jgi:ABC-type nitrate/sulfonate/bicarbonate transport system permease component
MIGICAIGVTGYLIDSFLLFLQRNILWWSDRGAL